MLQRELEQGSDEHGIHSVRLDPRLDRAPQRTSSFRFGSLEDLDDLVTTRDAPLSALDAFRDAGVRVHLA